MNSNDGSLKQLKNNNSKMNTCNENNSTKKRKRNYHST